MGCDGKGAMYNYVIQGEAKFLRVLYHISTRSNLKLSRLIQA